MGMTSAGMETKGAGIHWAVTLASMIALIPGSTAISFYTQSLFLAPLTGEFGWSRGDYFSAVSLAAIIGAFASPLVGLAADRWGVRRVLLTGIVCYGLSNVALGMLSGSLGQYTTLTVISGVFGMVQSPLLYAKAVTGWAGRRRGLALAIALSGTGLGGIVIPPLTGFLIEHFGWRVARYGLGATVILIAIPMVWFFIFEAGQTGGKVFHRVSAQAATGHSLKSAMRTRSFWLLLSAFFLSGAAINGILGNLVPLLTGEGFTMALASGCLSVLAAAQVIGRFISGQMLDVIQTAKIGILLFTSAIIGIALLALGGSISWIVVGAALLGLGLGSELELAGYFVGRFFGRRAFGQIYGIIFGAYTIGVGIGPLVMGRVFDIQQSYSLAILGLEIAIAFASILLLFVPPYTYPAISALDEG